MYMKLQMLSSRRLGGPRVPWGPWLCTMCPGRPSKASHGHESLEHVRMHASCSMASPRDTTALAFCSVLEGSDSLRSTASPSLSTPSHMEALCSFLGCASCVQRALEGAVAAEMEGWSSPMGRISLRAWLQSSGTCR